MNFHWKINSSDLQAGLLRSEPCVVEGSQPRRRQGAGRGAGAGLLTRAPAGLLCACVEALPVVLESVAAGPPPPGIGRSERTDHGGQTTGSGGWASVGTGRLPETG